MSKFGIALMTAAAISLLSGCQAAKEKHPTQEELIRQMQQRPRPRIRTHCRRAKPRRSN